MATTNLQQWNPTAVNQENDAQYTADSQRAGGATNPAIFQAELANKAYYQWSTFLTALFQAFANKGYTTSDSNISSLTAQCANFATSNDLTGLQTTLQAEIDAKQNILGFTPVQQGGGPNQGSAKITIGWDSPSSRVHVSVNGNDAGAVVFQFQLDATVASINSQLTSLNTSVSTLNDQVSTINGEIASINSTLAGKQDNLGFTPVQQGGGSGQAANKVFIGWSGSRLKGQVDSSDLGNIVFDSNLPPDFITGSVQDVTGGRSAGATFQNTSGHMIFVSGSFNGSGSQAFQVNGFTGPSSPSMHVCANQFGASTNGWPCGFAFFVPNGWFYQVTTAQTGGSLSLAGWFETQISS